MEPSSNPVENNIVNETKNEVVLPSKKKTNYFTFKQSEIIKRAINHFSLFERALFFILLSVMTLSSLILLNRANNIFTTEVPANGGELKEGVIGTPRFINPILAISDTDRDLTSLIYSGLMREDGKNGLIPDLAKSYSILDNGTTYDFVLKDNLTFHDGNKLTTDDVEYTIQKIQDGAIKSPKRANWDSVTIEKVSPTEIKFHLKQPYAPFLENTTVGIVEKNLFKGATDEELPFSYSNVQPIGAGPFMVETINRDSAGLPTSYVLVPFKNFSLQKPYLDSITFYFYPNEDTLLSAYKNGTIDSINSISPEKLNDLSSVEKQISHTPLPRIFGIFFNQNENPILSDQKVRAALESAIDRDSLIEKVFNGYAVSIDGPLPPSFGGAANKESRSEDERIAAARNILTADGWVYNQDTHVFEKITKKGKKTDKQTLSISISTGDAPEFKQTANTIKDTWQKVGVNVDVKIFEAGDLNQNVIRPRKYDALLFGEVIGRDLDFFAFWHSSQRNDPGLNIAMYTNSKTDKILEDARSLTDYSARLSKYQDFRDAIKSDTPAIFLYSPDFIYLVPKNLRGLDESNITIPSERFMSAYKWYIETERVWSFLAK